MCIRDRIQGEQVQDSELSTQAVIYLGPSSMSPVSYTHLDVYKRQALHGTNRSLLNNMVIGVSEGFVKNLEIVGVGVRAAVKGNILDLNLGKSHPINQVIPEGLKVTVTENTKVTVEGLSLIHI